MNCSRVICQELQGRQVQPQIMQPHGVDDLQIHPTNTSPYKLGGSVQEASSWSSHDSLRKPDQVNRDWPTRPDFGSLASLQGGFTMRRTATTPLAAFALAGLLAIAGQAIAAPCYNCYDGFCYVVGVGQPGWYVCIDQPHEECWVQQGTNCVGSLGTTVALAGGRVFAHPTAVDALFPSGTTERVLRLSEPVASCSGVAAELANLTGTDPEGWGLRFWHQSVASGRSALGTCGDNQGYLFTAEAGAANTAVRVFAEREGSPACVVAAATLQPDELLLTRVEFEGQPYVLVLQVRALDLASSSAKAEFRELQRQFKEDAEGAMQTPILALTVEHRPEAER